MNQNADKRTEYLVFGYIRAIEIQNQIIPSSIINLCMKFYHMLLKIICLQNHSNKPPIINIADLYNNKYFKFNESQPLNESMRTKTFKTHKVDYNSGICYIKNFKLPKYLIEQNNDKLSHKNVYDMIFLGGGYGLSDCYGYIIDTAQYHKTNIKNLDAFYWKLPSFSASVQCPYAVYSAKHGLITIGNFAESANGFNILKFEEYTKENENEWKWKESKLDTQRPQPSAAMIDDDRIITCGGWHQYQHCDLYDFNTKKWKKLPSTNEKRHNSGIYVDQFVNKRVYVGGGAMGKYKECEYYDISKNQWYSLPDTNMEYKFHPILWMENSNIINIASSYSKSFEMMDLRQRKWDVYVKSDGSKTFEDVFGASISANSIHVRLCA